MVCQLFDHTFPNVQCTPGHFRNIVQSARARAGLIQQTGQVYSLIKFLLNRRAPGTDIEDWFDVDWEMEEGTVTEAGTVNRLMYVSGLMLASFKKYGQFISLDATCKTNRFNMPFVLLVGTDDTMRTTIFGAGLIRSEDIESYTWLLNTFKRFVGTHISSHSISSVLGQSVVGTYTVLVMYSD